MAKFTVGWFQYQNRKQSAGSVAEKAEESLKTEYEIDGCTVIGDFKMTEEEAKSYVDLIRNGTRAKLLIVNVKDCGLTVDEKVVRHITAHWEAPLDN